MNVNANVTQDDDMAPLNTTSFTPVTLDTFAALDAGNRLMRLSNSTEKTKSGVRRALMKLEVLVPSSDGTGTTYLPYTIHIVVQCDGRVLGGNNAAEAAARLAIRNANERFVTAVFGANATNPRVDNGPMSAPIERGLVGFLPFENSINRGSL